MILWHSVDFKNMLLIEKYDPELAEGNIYLSTPSPASRVRLETPAPREKKKKEIEEEKQRSRAGLFWKYYFSPAEMV